MAITYNPRIVTDGLVLALDAGNLKSYNAGISTTAWTDLSGNGNTSTLTNGPTYSSANGGSLSFDGTNDYAGGSFSSPINLSYYSVDFWTKPSAFANYNQHVGFSSYSDTSPWNGFVFHSSSTGAIFTGTKLSGRLTPATSGMPTMTLNVWQNFTIVNNNGFVDVYKNGVQFISAANNGVSGSNNTFYSMGVTPSGGATNGLINGSFASLKVYSGKALTTSEVQQNFNALRGRFGI